MKKSRKIALGAAAAVAVVGAGVATTFLATAWGDSGGGRPSYTIDQVNQGVLGDKIVFNSISNSVIGDEKNFVGARVDDGDHGTGNKWHANEIEAVDGQTYVIRLYVHNNNPKGQQAVAENVRTSFDIPGASGKTVEVNGFISSSNATPDRYWDYIRFTANSNFHLEYIAGSALLENNGVGAGGGVKLGDEIINQNGALIGYNALDGRIPGCYQYASYVTVKVKVKYDNQPFKVEKQVRKAGETTDWRANWSESVTANVGDEIEYRIGYDNTTSVSAKDVMVKDVLPNNVSYVEGSTYMYNGSHPTGMKISDNITTKGVNIGDYAPNVNAYVIFKAKVNDENLICGKNTLTNWGQVSTGGQGYQDPADVIVNKNCDTGFTTDKQVRIAGTGDWQETVDANVGDEVEYRIAYKNTGNIDAKDVMVKDILPENNEFVAGSAKLYNATTSGKTLSDTIVTTGVNIGDYKPGETAYVTFKAKVTDKNLVCGANKLTNLEKTSVGDVTHQDTANLTVNKKCNTGFTTEKQVRIAGANDWHKTVAAKIGDEVEYRITYKNTGDVEAKDVLVKDALPTNTEFVAGSAKLYNSQESGKQLADTLVTTGVNIGNYQPDETAYITFKAKVTDKNLVCGSNQLTNFEKTSVGSLDQQDIADVTVEKNCSNPQPTPTPTEPTPGIMPSTGPAEIATGIVGAGAMTTAAGYYIASRRKLQ